MFSATPIQPLEIFLMNDQPFTCPHCGSRYEELADFYHTNAKCFIQQCLNDSCAFICYEEDEYYLKLWKVI
jgi:hypothetical protein